MILENEWHGENHLADAWVVALCVEFVATDNEAAWRIPSLFRQNKWYIVSSAALIKSKKGKQQLQEMI